MRRLTLILLAFSVAACGVERPLIRPKDIPAFEAAQQEKRDKVAREQAEQEKQNAADEAARKMIEDAQ